MPLYSDPTFIILIPAIILSIYAQIKVRTTFSKYQKVPSSRQLSGAQTAKMILQREALSHIPIIQQQGMLSDNYNPLKKELNLSPEVYNSTSLSAIGIAAHEAGHAVQHARAYWPLNIRTGFYPVANIGSKLAIPLIFLAFITSVPILLKVGIVLFSLSVFFTLITLPVEFDASRRAIALLTQNGIVSSEEIKSCKKVLSAAALTYVAATIVAVLQLIRLLLIARGRN